MAVTARVSVVIAATGRREHVEACVAALQRQAPPAPIFEVVLVGPHADAGEGGGEVPLRRVVYRSAGLAELWSEAARAATGEVLLFVPPATVPVNDLVARHAAAHEGEESRVVMGRIVPAFGAHPLAWEAVPEDDNDGQVLAGTVGQTISLRAALFRRVGGLPGEPRWGAEIVLLHRARGGGAHLHRLREAVGHQAFAARSADAVHVRLDAGRGSVELYQRYPDLLADLELGGFHAGTPPAPSLRRLLLRLGAPPLTPALGALLPSRRWRRRWLRFLHDYHFWRGVRRSGGAHRLWRALARPPVILMYHAIGDDRERPGRYIVPEARLRRQMRWLADRGYRVIALEELLALRRNHRPVPPRSVVITFDDGYADNHALALPVLRRYGFPATFFVVSGSVGDRNRWDAEGELAGRAMLSWGQARDLLAHGMDVGAHTRRHPVLPELPPEAAAAEIAGARHDLETALGRPVTTFAYPFGRLDQATTAAVGAAGYEGACCSRSGVNDPSVPALLLRRVEVRGTDSLARFALAVHRGRPPQRRR